MRQISLILPTMMTGITIKEQNKEMVIVKRAEIYTVVNSHTQASASGAGVGMCSCVCVRFCRTEWKLTLLSYHDRMLWDIISSQSTVRAKVSL